MRSALAESADVVHAETGMSMGIGGGGGNRAEAERWADEIRVNPGTAPRWDRSQWIRFALAIVPLIAIVVIGLLVL